MSDFRDYYGDDNNITEHFQVQILDKWIDNCLKKKKFSPEMKAVLKEIIKRRIEEYDLSPDELKEDMVSLCENLDKIEFAPIKKHPTYLGLFNRIEKKIVINTLAYDKMLANYGSKYALEKLYETLTHEVYHAMGVETDRENPNYGKDRFAHYDDFNYGIYQVALMETIIETAADRTSSDRSQEDFQNHKKQTDGYSDLTFIVPVLANAFGVSERDFLKYGLRSREKLILFLDKKIDDVEKTKLLLNKVEFSLGTLHREFYNKPKKNTKESEDVVREELPRIYSYVAEIMKARLESYEFPREGCSEEIEKMIFEHRSLQILFQNQVNTFSGTIRNQIFNRFNKCEPFNFVRKRIANLSSLDVIINSGRAKIKPKSDEHYLLIYKYRKGLLDGKEEEIAESLVGTGKSKQILTELLTRGKNSKLFDVNPELEEQRYKEDYNSAQKWYNSVVVNLLKREYSRRREDFFDKVGRVFGIKPKISLPGPARETALSQNLASIQNDGSEFGSLPDTERVEYEKRVKAKMTGKQKKSQPDVDKSDYLEK